MSLNITVLSNTCCTKRYELLFIQKLNCNLANNKKNIIFSLQNDTKMLHKFQILYVIKNFKENSGLLR